MVAMNLVDIERDKTPGEYNNMVKMPNLNIEGIYLDAETDGLYGSHWAVCAAKLDQDGKEIARFEARQAGYIPTNNWVLENAYPYNSDLPEVDDLYHAFATWWLENKDGCQPVWAHMGAPVEAGLFIEMNKRGLIGDFDGPYPLLDVAPVLMIAGFSADSVDTSAQILGVKPEGSPHDCRYDVAATVAVMKALKGL